MPRPLGVVVAGDPADALVASFARFNVEGLPRVDLSGEVDPRAPLLTAGRSRQCDAYVVVDPRVEFVRPFGRSDVVDPDGRPYVIASERPERRVEGDLPDEAGHERIRAELGLTGSRRLLARGLMVLDADLLRSFERDVLATRGWGVEDALRLCADEWQWYTAWAEASLGPALQWREPLVAMIDTPGARLAARNAGLTVDDVARGYVGMVWPDAPGAADSRHGALVDSLGTGALAGALVRRLTRKAPSVQRALGLDD